VNDPIKVRPKVSKVYSQHGTQLLVRSQHGAQTWLGSNPTPAIIFISNSNFTLTFQPAHVIEFLNQHGAQPVGTNPEKQKSLTLKFSLSNRKFTSNFSHVSQHDAQLTG